MNHIGEHYRRGQTDFALTVSAVETQSEVCKTRQGPVRTCPLTPGGQLALGNARQAQRLHALYSVCCSAAKAGQCRRSHLPDQRIRVAWDTRALHRYLDEAGLKLFPCTEEVFSQ